MEPWLVLYLVVFVVGALGGVLLRSGMGLLVAAENGPVLERLQWLFPLRGKWLRRGLGALFLLLGLPLLPAVVITTGFVGAVAVGLSPFAFAVMVLRSSVADLLTSRRKWAAAQDREGVGQARERMILLAVTRMAGAIGTAAAYGWAIWCVLDAQPR